jgi:hypothetical protein
MGKGLFLTNRNYKNSLTHENFSSIKGKKQVKKIGTSRAGSIGRPPA